jgi:hypothetical protein
MKTFTDTIPGNSGGTQDRLAGREVHERLERSGSSCPEVWGGREPAVDGGTRRVRPARKPQRVRTVERASQWIFGTWASHLRRPSLRHTLTGIFIHHLTATGWALIHERVFGRDRTSSVNSDPARAAEATSVVSRRSYG